METFKRLLNLADSEVVNEGLELPKIKLHKWLVLGQTEYVCRNGTLSDGHEKLTDAQRYAQAIKERYYLSLSIKQTKAQAKRAQADLIDARIKLIAAATESQTLRAEADIEQAEASLASALVTVEDQMRMVKTYYAVEKELAPKVEAQYPEGIEQAEPDSWSAVAKFRLLKRSLGYQENLTHVPLEMNEKAKLGLEYRSPDLSAWYAINRGIEAKELNQFMHDCQLSLEDKSNANDSTPELTIVK